MPFHLDPTLLGMLPMLFAGVAAIDVMRSGANRAWLWVILAFPMFGPIAYFLCERAPWSARSLVGGFSAAKRRVAKKRVRELEIQIVHFRAPALVAELGDNLLDLERFESAEACFREALAAEREPSDDTRAGLARALEAQGKWSEAIPLLEELVKKDPRRAFGSTRFGLARALQETGQLERAESVLREIVADHSFLEARVRLAQLLLVRGAKPEAEQILRAIEPEAKALPKFVRRESRAWVRGAKRLLAGKSVDFPSALEARAQRRQRLTIAAVAAFLAVVACGVWWVVG